MKEKSTIESIIVEGWLILTAALSALGVQTKGTEPGEWPFSLLCFLCAQAYVEEGAKVRVVQQRVQQTVVVVRCGVHIPCLLPSNRGQNRVD